MSEERRQELAATLEAIRADMDHCGKTCKPLSECKKAYLGLKHLAMILKELLEADDVAV